MSWDALHAAATDRVSGSAQIACRAADALARVAEEYPADGIRDAARTLVRGQPIMAACLRLIHVVLRGLDEDGPEGARRAAAGFGRRLRDEQDALADELSAALPLAGTVVTVSASSSVTAALCRRDDLRVLCAASEPGGEGRDLAEHLRSNGIDAVVVPDPAVERHSVQADAVVFGADAVGTRSVLNKTGTRGAARGARSNRRRAICVAGTSKLLGDDAWPASVSTAERMLLEGTPFFEEIPSTLITTFVTERGPRSVRTMRNLARAATLDRRIIDWMCE